MARLMSDAKKGFYTTNVETVKKVIDKHNFKLNYVYENDSNVFKIYLLKSL